MRPSRAAVSFPAGPGDDHARAVAHARTLLDRTPWLADEQARAILAVVPHSAQAQLLRGLALAAMARIDDAVVALRHAVRLDTDSAEGWRALGDQLVLVGDGPGADAAYAQHLRCAVRDPRLQAAAVSLCRNDLPVAERLLKGHLKACPTDIAAIRMLAELAGRIGRHHDAEALLIRALELAPGFDVARFNLATLLYRNGRTAAAIVQLERLLLKDPDNVACRNLAAAALGRIGEIDKAIDHYEALIARQPGNDTLWLSYGHALKTVGRQAESVAAYRRCVAIRPGFGEAWWSLANLKTVRLEAGDIAAMRAALAGETLDAEDRYHLHFALGKAHEDVGEDALAFPAYMQGNALRRAGITYDPGATRALVDRSVAALTPDFFATRAGHGCDAADPIFILGMPRAGSTLIEQILASHPDIEGTQELPEMMLIAGGFGAEDDRSAYPATLPDGPALRALGERYLRETAVQRKSGRPLFIDKMPNNWMHVGLIHLILPNARIIDARRHPLGCCFSNFKQHFARGQGFSYALDTMGAYYADYVRLMDHIDAVLPGRVHRVFYEKMIDDTEGEVRRLLDHVGVAFDPACLRFHENARAVRTASSEQVRQPIFRDGKDQWRRFAAWLGPLETALGPVLDAYPYR